MYQSYRLYQTKVVYKTPTKTVYYVLNTETKEVHSEWNKSSDSFDTEDRLNQYIKRQLKAKQKELRGKK